MTDTPQRKLLFRYAIIMLVVSVPFSALHLAARPDDAQITLVQHFGAALANFFGPWGVALVRLMNFPNAGMRSFSWALALGLTALGGLFLAMAPGIRNQAAQGLVTACWALFALAWFGTGFLQIASGLL